MYLFIQLIIGTVRTKVLRKHRVIMKGSPYYAEVAYDVVDTYMLLFQVMVQLRAYKGMVDSNRYDRKLARLSSGQWVFKDKVRIYSQAPNNSGCKKGNLEAGKDNDVFELTMTSLAAAIVSYDGQNVVLNVSAPASAALPKLPNNSIVST